MKRLFTLLGISVSLLFGPLSFVGAVTDIQCTGDNVNIKECIGRVGDAASKAGFAKDTTIESVVTAAIQGFLGVLGIIFLAIVIYAGFLWMNAQGDPKQVEKAQAMLIQGTIGLAIVLAAYAISIFVISALGGAVGISQ